MRNLAYSLLPLPTSPGKQNKQEVQYWTNVPTIHRKHSPVRLLLGCFSLESYADAESRVRSDWSTTVVLKPLAKVSQEKKLQDRDVMWTDMP